MSIRQRLKRLERDTKDRNSQAADAGALRLHQAIMNDPVAHELFVRIVHLTPDAVSTPNFDFYKAAAERPGLAEAAAELGRRLQLHRQ